MAMQSPHIQNIRKRPGMYVGPCDSTGIQHLADEVIGNSVDQFLAGNATRISVQLRGPAITVSDDGPGLFHVPGIGRRNERHLTDYHNSPTADGHAPHIHLAPRGVGLVCVNALTSKFVVRSRGHRSVLEMVFSRGGKLSSRSIPAKGGSTGTTVTFTPDPEIFGEHRACKAAFRSRLFQTAHLYPGLSIHFGNERFHAPNGLGDLSLLFSGGKGPSFHYSANAGPCFVHAAAAGRVTERTSYVSWVNGRPTAEHGLHVDAFRAALRKSKWSPAFAAIHVIMLFPRYAGPVRDKLVTADVFEPVYDALLPVIRDAVRNSVG